MGSSAGEGGKAPPVNALHQARGSELAQVAANGVLRGVELPSQSLAATSRPSLAQALEQPAPPFLRRGSQIRG